MQKKYRIIPLAAVSAVTLMLACSGQNDSKQNPSEDVEQVKPVIRPERNSNLPIPMEVLGQGARAPTDTELEQEKQFNLQQIAQAEQRLKSKDIQQRVIGTEQLNAYQLPVAEALLLKTLIHDSEPIVRKSAAQSLGLFKTLSDDAIDKLLVALKDKDSATCKMALDTLLTFSTRVNMDSQRFPQILFKLKKKLKAGQLDSDVHKGLQAFVDDQKPIKKVFFLNAIPAENNAPKRR